MVSCAVWGCSNRTGRDRVGFYRVPKVIRNQCPRTRDLSERRRTTWLERIGRHETDVTGSGLHVCGAHFLRGYPSKLFEETSPDWAPSVGLEGQPKRPSPEDGPSGSAKKTKMESEEAETKEEPKDEPKDEKPVSEGPAGVGSPADPKASEDSESDDGGTKQSECQTELTTKDIFDLEREVSTMACEMDTLRAKILDTELSEQAFQQNEGKVRFYTGFSSYALLMVAFNFVKVGLEPSQEHVTLFQEFTMFMLRIRLNLPLRGLAFRFKVTEGTASKICDRWLDAMYVRLGFVINWPDRDEQVRNLPSAYAEVLAGRLAVVVDCFEVYIDRPAEPLGQCATWVTYKNHNTVKFLIGISVQGQIVYISEACGGRANNKYVTEHSGLLKNLRAGDVVLAERGFGVAESVGFCCARVLPPTPAEQRKQLVAIDMQEMWKFVPFKALVEQEVGVVKNKYHALQSCLPLEFLTCRDGEEASVIDKIVTVCCALTNLSKSVLSLVQTV